MSAQILPFRSRPTQPMVGEFKFSFGVGRTFIIAYADGYSSWSDGLGSGRAFRTFHCDARERPTGGATVIIGPYKAYGSAFHASDDRPDIQADAAREMAVHVQRAASLPDLPPGTVVLHWSEIETGPRGAA